MPGFKTTTGKQWFQPSLARANTCRDVALFSYWTVSNVPLFLLAAPMLWILSYSAFQALWPVSTSRHGTSEGQATNPNKEQIEEGALVRLALPQLVLGVLALFVYNVQIITRLSSGYPLWYIWLAERLVNSRKLGHTETSLLGSKSITRFMILYAVIQGGMYASFLPPA